MTDPHLEDPLRLVSQADFPSRYGRFTIHAFEWTATHSAYVVLTHGELGPDTIPLLRIHSQCLTGDVLGSLRCDCGDQLARALKRIDRAGCGLLIYDPQEGRGIGILAKLQAYALQDAGADTVEANRMLGFEADLRQYDACVAILRHFGVNRVHLLSNNPEKVAALERGGVAVAARVPLRIRPRGTSRAYLETKRDKMGHLLGGMCPRSEPTPPAPLPGDTR